MISNRKNLAFGAILSYLAIAINIVIGLLYTPWMIEQIGSSNYGIYTLATSIIAMFAMDFGLGQAVTKFISRYKSLGEEEKIPGFLGAVYQLYLIISAIIFVLLLVLFFCIEYIYVKLTPEEISNLRIVFIIAGLFSVISFPFQPLNGVLVSNQKFIALKSFDMATKIITVVCIVICLLFKMGLYSLVIVNAGVGLLVILSKFLYVRFFLKIKPKFGKMDGKLIKSIFSFSVFIFIMSVANTLTRGLMPTVLGITCGTKEITVYSLANTIVGYIYMIEVALDGMFLPKVTDYVIKEDYEGLNVFTKKLAVLQMIITGCVMTVFIGCGKEFVFNWVGGEFINVYLGVIIFLIPGYFINTINIGRTIMIANDNIKVLVFNYILNVFICLPLSFGLSYLWGALGIFVSLAICNMLISVIIASVIYRKKAYLQTGKLFLHINLRNIPAILLTLVICYFVQKHLPTTSLLLVMVKCAFIALIYVVLTCLCLLNKDDYHKLKLKILKKRSSYE